MIPRWCRKLWRWRAPLQGPPPSVASAFRWHAGSQRRRSMSRACAVRGAISWALRPWMTPRSCGPWRLTATSGERCRAASSQSGSSTRPPSPHHALRWIFRLVGAAPKYRASTYLNAPTNPMGARRRAAIWPNEPKSAQCSRRHFHRTHPTRSGCRCAIWPNEPEGVECGGCQFFGRTNPGRSGRGGTIWPNEPEEQRWARRNPAERTQWTLRAQLVTIMSRPMHVGSRIAGARPLTAALPGSAIRLLACRGACDRLSRRPRSGSRCGPRWHGSGRRVSPGADAGARYPPEWSP